MVKTCLCIFQKLKDGEQILDDDECLLVELENIGYDSTGKPIGGSEIPELISLFNEKVGWE
jgi:type I restriction enzyme M protein